MKFINSLLGLTITIDNELVKLLEECASDYYPNEFGGLLIGEYSEDKKNVSLIEHYSLINLNHPGTNLKEKLKI